jgi:membrane-bound ClpP family serine protease
MLIQPPPAETFDYMVLGFAVILGSMGLFLVSLVVRYRNLKRDLDLLEEMEAKESA